MIQPAKEEVMALVRLKSSKDFEIITNWLRNSMIQQSLDNIHQRDGVEDRMMQGRCQELDEFLKHVKEAESNLKRMQEPQKSMTS